MYYWQHIKQNRNYLNSWQLFFFSSLQNIFNLWHLNCQFDFHNVNSKQWKKRTARGFHTGCVNLFIPWPLTFLFTYQHKLVIVSMYNHSHLHVSFYNCNIQTGFSLAQCLLTETFSHGPAPKGEQLGLSQHKISVSIHLVLNGRTSVLGEKGCLQNEEEQLWLGQGRCGRGRGSGGACTGHGAVTSVQDLSSIPAQSTFPAWCVLMVTEKQRRFCWKATFGKRGGEEIYAENPCKKTCEKH